MMDDNSPLDPHGIPKMTDEELGEELAELISRLKSKYGTDCNKWTSHIKFAYDSNPENTVEFIEGVMEDIDGDVDITEFDFNRELLKYWGS